MKTKFKFLRAITIVIIVLSTAIAIFDSCETIEGKNKYQVNSSLCIGCKKCLAVCPVNAISIVNGKAVINSQKCIGCGRC